MLVVDASVALWACGAGGRWEGLRESELVAPALMWSEFSSSLHAALWRREIRRANALASLAALDRAPVELRAHSDLRREAWRLADDLGWAKTCDAEYVALATLLGTRLVTLDARPRRGADRLGVVVAPGEL